MVRENGWQNHRIRILLGARVPTKLIIKEKLKLTEPEKFFWQRLILILLPYLTHYFL